MFKESITREELTELPKKQFEGEIIIIDHARQAKEAADYLRNYRVIGFDTETRPSFAKGEFHTVALLQLATSDKAFLIRTMKAGLPFEIRNLFADRKIIKPGAAIRDDLKALQKIQHFRPEGFVELQDHAKEIGIQNFSLKKLAAIVLGFRISKAQQLSNWESDQLTDAQILYAATDAWVSLKIYEKLFEYSNGA